MLSIRFQSEQFFRLLLSVLFLAIFFSACPDSSAADRRETRREAAGFDYEARVGIGGFPIYGVSDFGQCGSGGFFGLGLGKSRMKYSWVSEPANDFIFTITCEELGFLGAILILGIFALFIKRGFTVALRNEDIFSRIAALGITVKVAIQVLLNIAVITNSIPNTGISLPFFSYGGSSLLMLFAEMGILLSVSRSSALTYR